MTLTRIRAGHYVSRRDRVEIERVYSRQTGRPDEVYWVVTVQDRVLPGGSETLWQARARAEQAVLAEWVR